MMKKLMILRRGPVWWELQSLVWRRVGVHRRRWPRRRQPRRLNHDRRLRRPIDQKSFWIWYLTFLQWEDWSWQCFWRRSGSCRSWSRRLGLGTLWPQCRTPRPLLLECLLRGKKKENKKKMLLGKRIKSNK